MAYGSGDSRYTGKTAAEFDADYRARLDGQPVATRCFFCDWTYNGTAAEGREAARDHRLVEHPKAGRKRRPKNAGLFAASPRRVLSADDEQHRQDALVEAAARRVALAKPEKPTCRRDGCQLEPVSKARRGRFAVLCHEHEAEERRAHAAAMREARARIPGDWRKGKAAA